MTAILRLTAFSSDPEGGNPAGVVLDASQLDDTAMQRIAAEIGYAETAFVVRPATAADPERIGIRYFSPVAEVPFCGHATVATAIALAEGGGGRQRFVFETAVGEVVINTMGTDAGVVASFTSVEPRVDEFDADILAALLSLIGVAESQLDQRFPPRLAYAGNVHPVIVIEDSEVFDSFTFDPAAARKMMNEQGWTGTITVLHCTSPGAAREFEARNLFPVGTMNEDPATGSAAAAVGGYLRDLGLAPIPGHVTINQGRHVGRPSVLAVKIPRTGGIIVSGTAAVIDEAAAQSPAASAPARDTSARETYRDETYANGMAVLSSVHGMVGEHFIDSLAETSPELAHQIVGWAYGEMYDRPALVPRDRQLVILGMLTALGDCEPELEVHIRASLNVGLTREQVIEALLHSSVYCGFPRAVAATTVAKKVFAQLDGAE